MLNFEVEDSKAAKDCKSDRSRQALSNEDLLAKIGFNAAENEFLKVCEQVTRQLNRLS